MWISVLDPPEPAKHNQEKLLDVTWSMTTLNVILLVASFYIVIKVYRMVLFKDLPLLLSIVSISLALTCFLIYNILMLIATYQMNDIDGYNNLYLNTDRGVNFRLSIDQLKVMFTFCAFNFDLYKWCVFIVATKQNVES